jgi:hypothetical protein
MTHKNHNDTGSLPVSYHHPQHKLKESLFIIISYHQFTKNRKKSQSRALKILKNKIKKG